MSQGGGSAPEDEVPQDGVLGCCGALQSSQLKALQRKYQKSLLLTLKDYFTAIVQILLLFNKKIQSVEQR